MTKKNKVLLIISAIVALIVVISIVRFFNNRLSPTTSVVGMAMDSDFGLMEDVELGAQGSAPKLVRTSANMAGEMAPVMYDEVVEDTTETTERLIIKTGSFSVVVLDVNEAINKVADLAVEKGGFLVSSNIYKSGVSPAGTIIIRIPADIFDEGVNNIKQLGEVKSESINGQDVTEEYVDLEAQLRNLRVTENQFLEIMKSAYKIEDILAVQRELTNVRDRIERLEGRMKYLKQSADLSTITVHMSTNPDVLPVVDEEDAWKPWGEVKEAIRSLLEMAKGLSYLLIWFVVYIPLFLLVTLVFWLVYRFVKRKINKNPEKNNL